MKRSRLEWEAGEQLLEKEKTLRAKQERLKRLEKKVKTAYLVFMPEMVQCYCGFDLKVTRVFLFIKNCANFFCVVPFTCFHSVDRQT